VSLTIKFLEILWWALTELPYMRASPSLLLFQNLVQLFLGFVMLLKLEHDTGAQIFPPLRAMKAYRSVVVEAAQNPRGGDALAPQSEIGLALQLIWIGR